eukprot:SAG25_NODE_6305_length_570_cov_1.929936_1_plen_41_part_01
MENVAAKGPASSTQFPCTVTPVDSVINTTVFAGTGYGGGYG